VGTATVERGAVVSAANPGVRLPVEPNRFRCRRCATPVDGMGTTCDGCGTPQRIILSLADGQIRYLPKGMTLDEFDRLLERGY
jgi:hypothetical protein